MVEVKEISADITLPLRQSVLRPHLTLEQCGYEEDNLSSSFHLGAYISDELVGIASFIQEDYAELQGKNTYRLRQMGIQPKLHGKGVGRLLIEKTLEILKQKECEYLWCQAREVAFPFYERMGFQYLGEYFDIPEIGLHKIMFQKI